MENEKPLFSIVIPSYNYAHYIDRCIDSVLEQCYKNWEIIIVDNYSTDNTEEVVKRYADKRIHFIKNHNNGIIAISRNKGIELAKGEWICFLDADDWWKSDKLETCLPFLDDYDFIYHNVEVKKKEINCDGLRRFPFRKVKGENILSDLLIKGNCICNSTVVVRKKIVDQVGKLSEDKDLIAVEDFDYWLRVALVTTRFKCVDKVLGYYWVHETLSHSLRHVERERNLYCKYKNYIDDINYSKLINNLIFKEARFLHVARRYRQASKMYFTCLCKSLGIRIKFNAVLGIMLCCLHIKR
ncbi:glycosyltransferase [Butyricimonas sp. Marseille-P3923]|uniref:glycosyltransferase n=1 Tax=Butyricimonas sp. Marseille-P3923 TaxID=1987504 RepID=UPI00159BEDCE|nr:glycosyltransferase [Butyricimonas sp. Marseille-P3923]